MSFFPVNSTTITATVTTSIGFALPTPVVNGTQIRITRQASSDRVFIKFGSSASVAATTASVELISGEVEIWEMPDANSYGYYAVICSANTVDVNISISPRFE